VIGTTEVGREGAFSFWIARADGLRRKVRPPPAGSGLDVSGGDDVVGSPLRGLDPRLSGEGRRDAVEDSKEDPTGPGIRGF